VVASEINPGFPYTGTWYDFFSGDSIIAGTSDNIALAPGEFHIYSSKRFESPEEDPVTSLEEIFEKLPQGFLLNQNYPNPFNPITAIKYSIANASDVKLTIFDIQGRRVRTLVNKHQSAGSYSVDFSGIDLSSGTYFYSFKAGSFYQTRKMLLIK